MKFFSLPFPKNPEYKVFFFPFIIALLARILFLLLDIPDFLGDAFHNWYISVSTLQNHWTYSDYKGREVVWLPTYRYLITFAMKLFHTDRMWVSDLVNVILGAASCGLTGLIAYRFTNYQYAIASGALLALLPSHMSYSTINTPEVLATLILAAIIYCYLSHQLIWLIPLTFIGVLTRNEFTLLLSVFGGILLLRKEWKPSLYLVIGGTIGIGIWTWWCYEKTGSPIFWLTQRAVGSRWDHLFQVAQGKAAHNPTKFLEYWIRSFPYLVLVPPLMVLKGKTIFNGLKEKGMQVITILVWAHWMFLFLMAFRFFPQLSIRYFLLSLPLACIMLIFWIYTTQGPLKKVLLISLIISCTISLTLQIPTNYLKKYAYAGTREIGYFIRQNEALKGNFWVDYPLSIYYSQLPIERFFSGGQLLREGNEPEKNLEENDVRFILSASSSFSVVHKIWPEMKSVKAFEKNGIQYEPLFIYQPEDFLREENNWFDSKVNEVTRRQGRAALWEVTFLPQN